MYYRKCFIYFIFVVNYNIICGDISASNKTEENKPIFRSQVTEGTFEPQWLTGLRQKINEAINSYGYKDAKRYIAKYVDEIEKNAKLLLHVKVNPKGLASVEHKPILKTGFSGDYDDADRDSGPDWLKDLKDNVKVLINMLGRETASYILIPIVLATEYMYSVKITDIDVDQSGEVIVKYHEVDEVNILGTTTRSRKNRKRKYSRIRSEKRT
ncbi:uncharacterized protein LOC123720864 isoform X2 [Pieris brassicae]|uniref:uncharacterized protein LOC123720864 isoform X2 n=1 Tax=Pieris brassicae TaxID=7116 RepID=UPI001E65FB0F|nr:uncharacterized protein LOC123720864 isoform X2 [Pieris brassicae]